jgi:hypothetical protein
MYVDGKAEKKGIKGKEKWLAIHTKGRLLTRRQIRFFFLRFKSEEV